MSIIENNRFKNRIENLLLKRLKLMLTCECNAQQCCFISDSCLPFVSKPCHCEPIDQFFLLRIMRSIIERIVRIM